MLDRSILNSIESKISEALINSKISHEDVMTILNEGKKYRELKESINGKALMVEQQYYQNVKYGVVKNQDLLKTKKQKDY